MACCNMLYYIVLFHIIAYYNMLLYIMLRYSMLCYIDFDKGPVVLLEPFTDRDRFRVGSKIFGALVR